MVNFASQISIVLLLLLSMITFYKGTCSTNMKHSCNVKDQAALLTFKHGVVDHTNKLSSWSSEEDCCAFKGVHCDSVTGRVTRLDLNQEYLEGEIPPELFGLTQLLFLNLSRNHFMGKIPSKIGGMKNLESLDLSNNHLYGEIPATISNLSFLSYLNLSYNDFTGQIPSGPQLQTFDAWSYVGNPKLCGPPLTKSCSKEENHD